MPGLNLRGYGGVAATNVPAGPAGGSSNGSVTAAAFGSGYSAPQQGLGSTLTPNDTGGMVFCSGLVGLVILLLIRKSLPR
jgi:hypothetical protein